MKKAFVIITATIFLSACSAKKVPDLKVAPPVPVVKSSNAISYDCVKDKNAFELLKSNNHQVDFTQSTYGKLITSIDGKSQGEGKYWLYSVDTKEATVGAEAYTCQNQEKIEWELK